MGIFENAMQHNRLYVMKPSTSEAELPASYNGPHPSTQNQIIPLKPFFEGQGVRLLRVLTDRGSEYCGNLEHHEYELFLALEDIDHTKAKAKSPQANGICEQFHRTMLDEFYRVAFRKKLYGSLEELQADADKWIEHYNTERTHSGKYCYGKTPMETLLASKKLAEEKMLGMLPVVSAAENSGAQAVG
jgi:transposase InsO family protein